MRCAIVCFALIGAARSPFDALSRATDASAICEVLCLPRWYPNAGSMQTLHGRSTPAVRTNPEPSPKTLERLAQLLRDRHKPSSGRSFVMLLADRPNTRPNTDDLATQPIPVMRSAIG